MISDASVGYCSGVPKQCHAAHGVHVPYMQSIDLRFKPKVLQYTPVRPMAAWAAWGDAWGEWRQYSKLNDE